MNWHKRNDEREKKAHTIQFLARFCNFAVGSLFSAPESSQINFKHVK